MNVGGGGQYKELASLTFRRKVVPTRHTQARRRKGLWKDLIVELTRDPYPQC